MLTNLRAALRELLGRGHLAVETITGVVNGKICCDSITFSIFDALTAYFALDNQGEDKFGTKLRFGGGGISGRNHRCDLVVAEFSTRSSRVYEV